MLLEKEVIETIEKIILNHGIAEIKLESKGVVVVEVSRKVKYPLYAEKPQKRYIFSDRSL